MRRIGKMALVWTTVLLLVVDPVSACRWRARWGSCSPCQSSWWCTPCRAPSVVTVDSTTPCPCATSSDAATFGPSVEVLPAPETSPHSAPTPAPAPAWTPTPAPAPTATWGPGPSQSHKPVPVPAPQPTPAPKPVPAPPQDEPDGLDDLFKEETSAGGDADKQGVTDAAEAPAAADGEEAAGAKAVDAMSDDPAAEDAVAKPDSADEDVDFGDAAPDKASADEPDMANTDEPGDADEPADEMPAKDAAVDETMPAPEEEESDDDDLPEPKSSSESHGHDADAALAQSAADRPTADDGMRLWTDNTGRHQVRARLVKVFDGKVRLEKETGRFTTVPFERLSLGDLAFVRRQAPAVASTGTQQTAWNQTGVGR
jgi:SLA1 homology domain 1, SHD1